MDKHQYCVIMAGGYGNRFWPVTRESRPKQFIYLSNSNRSLVRAAYERCLGVVPQENILLITLDRFKEYVHQSIPELPEENLLLEPYGRKTAPCIVYATYAVLKRDPEAVIAMIPADQIIYDGDCYRKTLSDALAYAASRHILLTLGVVPTRPDPNYGYIQVAGGQPARDSDQPVPVKTFTEKPDPDIAQVFCDSGEFFWNTGVFVWQASVIREECERYIPEITSLFAGWDGALGSPAEKVFLERAYTDCSKQSIDYGVMEKTEIAWVYPSRFGWSDIDSWENLYASFPDKDEDGNFSNTTRPYFSDNKGCMIIADDTKKMLAIKGLENYLVLDTPDVLLVCPRDDQQYRDFTGNIALPGYEDIR